MNTVDLGDMGVLVNPEYVYTLTTREAIESELEAVRVSDVEFAYREFPEDFVVPVEEYQAYLESLLAKLSEKRSPSHHQPYEEEDDDVVLEQSTSLDKVRYEQVVKGLMLRIKELEASKPVVYVKSTDESVEESLRHLYSDSETHEVVDRTFTYRGFLGDKVARVEIDTIYGDGTYDRILGHLE